METKAVHGRELGDYVAVIRRRWLIVLVSMVVCLGAGVAYLAVAPKTYVSTAKVQVFGLPSATSVAEGSRTTDAINLDTEAQLVKSAAVYEQAAAQITGNAEDGVPLARRVTVTVPPNTTVLAIEYAAPGKEEAQKGAQEFANAYLAAREAAAQKALDDQTKLVEDALANTTDKTERQALTAQLSALTSTVIDGGDVINFAQKPNKPRDPNPMLVLPSALFLGLLLGLALALWRDNRDRRIHTSSDIDRLFGLTPLTNLKVVLGGGVGRDSRHYDVRALYHSLRANGPDASEVILVVAPDSPSIAGGICRALGAAAARSGAVTTYVTNEKVGRGIDPRASGGVLRTMNYRDADLVYEGEINAERLQMQISSLRADNDFIVLGLPSDNPTVDLPMLCRHVDVVLVLVHLGQATRTSVAETLRSLRTARAHTVFAVSVDMRRQRMLERGRPLSEDGFVEESPSPVRGERPLSKALEGFGKSSDHPTADNPTPERAGRSERRQHRRWWGLGSWFGAPGSGRSKDAPA